MIFKIFGERLLSFFILTFFLFILVRALPGDPVDMLAGEFALPVQKQRIQESLGLDKPVLQQAVVFYKNLAQLDLGNSFTRQKPVREILGTYFKNTLILALLAFLMAQVFAMLWAFANIFVRHKVFKNFSNAGTAVFLSLPSFWLGPLLISAWCLNWPWLPLAESNNLGSVFLPAFTLSLGFAAMLQKMTTFELHKALATDYARTGFSKGASFFRVVLVHALPNAFLPLLSFSMIKLAQLLTGALIVEGIFHWPGLGQLMLEAVLQRDYPTLQGITLLICFFYLMTGFISDWIQISFLKRTSNVDTAL